MTTAIVNLLNKPIMRSRTDHGRDEEREQPQGIVLQTLMISLLLALITSLLSFAVMWGTFSAQISAANSRIDRLEKITDADRERERTRGPANHVTLPLFQKF